MFMAIICTPGGAGRCHLFLLLSRLVTPSVFLQQPKHHPVATKWPYHSSHTHGMATEMVTKQGFVIAGPPPPSISPIIGKPNDLVTGKLKESPLSRLCCFVRSDGLIHAFHAFLMPVDARYHSPSLAEQYASAEAMR